MNSSPAVLESLLEPVGLSGALSLQWLGRRTHNESDQDVSGTIDLHGEAYFDERVTFDLAGFGSRDIFGSQHEAGGAVREFRDLGDSYSDRFYGRVWRASASYDQASDDGLHATLGRHDVFADRGYTFDGATAGYRNQRRFRVAGFGGIPARFYENHRSGDWLAGALGEYRPYPNGLARAGYIRVHEGEPSRSQLADRDDQRLALSYRQRLGEHITVLGDYHLRDTESERVRLFGQARCPWSEVELSVDYRRLIDAQSEADQTLGPFTQVLSVRRPYESWDIRLSRALFEDGVVEAGYASRTLRRNSDEGRFNREWQRWHGLLGWQDLLVEGLGLSARGEWWRSEGGRTVSGVTLPSANRVAGEGDASFTLDSLNLTASAGVDYALWMESAYPYPDQTLSTVEREDAWSAFARLRWEGDGEYLAGVSFSAEYRREWETRRVYQELLLRVGYEF